LRQILNPQRGKTRGSHRLHRYMHLHVKVVQTGGKVTLAPIFRKKNSPGDIFPESNGIKMNRNQNSCNLPAASGDLCSESLLNHLYQRLRALFSGDDRWCEKQKNMPY